MTNEERALMLLRKMLGGPDGITNGRITYGWSGGVRLEIETTLTEDELSWVVEQMRPLFAARYGGEA